MRPDPNEAIPNPSFPSLCCIKNVVTNPNIIVGDYTYYDDKDGAERFEEHVTHFYPFIGANSVVAGDIPPYCIAAGNPCRIIRKRFDDELTDYLLELRWWDWPVEKIESNFRALSSGDLSLIRKTDR